MQQAREMAQQRSSSAMQQRMQQLSQNAGNALPPSSQSAQSSQQGKPESQGKDGTPTGENTASTGADEAAIPDAFGIRNVNRKEKGGWGQLREKTADDLTQSKRNDVAPGYRKQVETYFRILSQQAKEDAAKK